MSERMAKDNTRRSTIRSGVAYVFAHEKGPMGLLIRTNGIVRAEIKIGMANLAYTFRRLVWHQGRTSSAWATDSLKKPSSTRKSATNETEIISNRPYRARYRSKFISKHAKSGSFKVAEGMATVFMRRPFCLSAWR
ncbi:MAG: hypothetical protein VYD57_16905 [Pseudomonadota bacterium]|nr:hypothetical protein [Pseudomonadota bacterium]